VTPGVRLRVFSGGSRASLAVRGQRLVLLTTNRLAGDLWKRSLRDLLCPKPSVARVPNTPLTVRYACQRDDSPASVCMARLISAANKSKAPVASPMVSE
jgi:hypothetical protein